METVILQEPPPLTRRGTCFMLVPNRMGDVWKRSERWTWIELTMQRLVGSMMPCEIVLPEGSTGDDYGRISAPVSFSSPRNDALIGTTLEFSHVPSNSDGDWLLAAEILAAVLTQSATCATFAFVPAHSEGRMHNNEVPREVRWVFPYRIETMKFVFESSGEDVRSTTVHYRFVSSIEQVVDVLLNPPREHLA